MYFSVLQTFHSELFPSSLIPALQVTLPVVITSLLEVVEPVALGGQVPSIEFQRTQTPTVRLDVQVYESGDELVINFDFDERWLREDVVRQLMTSFKEARNSAKHAHVYVQVQRCEAMRPTLVSVLRHRQLTRRSFPRIRRCGVSWSVIKTRATFFTNLLSQCQCSTRSGNAGSLSRAGPL